MMKFTNAVCETYNQTWVSIEQCRLRAIRRNKTVLNIDLTVHYPAHHIQVKFDWLKKASGYKPWLFAATIDACAFMRKPNNPVAKMLHNFFRNASTVNHTCPYMGLQQVKNFYVKPEQMLIPLPTGEYAIFLTWIFSGVPQFVTNVYFTFLEDLLKQ
ncbi:uncharacterized protein LOC124460053 [Drosophila willistoni]|uniref:uncharacterized protein LOC124460053 n=1 Tax=Drosophila willistoni TaxID=7260 RepID=UPI001F087487|nr:uncharacterized protein LOC124460053 [Drosophila willistoni]